MANNSIDKAQTKLCHRIATGKHFSMVIGDDGRVYSWGRNEYGQLGKSFANRFLQGFRTKPNAVASPINALLKLVSITPIKSLVKVTCISAGSHHSLAVCSNGRVYSWGKNNHGELGLGHSRSIRIPTIVPSLKGISTVSASVSSFAVSKKGFVFSWGPNEFSILGYAFQSKKVTSPQQIPGLSHIIKVTPSLRHVLALSENKCAFIWGDDTSLQFTSQKKIRQLPFTESIIDIAIGNSAYPHCLLLTQDNTIISFGNNTFGQLGRGNENRLGIISGIKSEIVSLSAGSKSSFALCKDGTLYRWGLEIDNYYTTKVPQQSQFFQEEGSFCLAHCSKYDHSITVMGDGTLRMTGLNNYGQATQQTIRFKITEDVIPATSTAEYAQQEVIVEPKQYDTVEKGKSENITAKRESRDVFWGIKDHPEDKYISKEYWASDDLEKHKFGNKPEDQYAIEEAIQRAMNHVANKDTKNEHSTSASNSSSPSDVTLGDDEPPNVPNVDRSIPNMSQMLTNMSWRDSHRSFGSIANDSYLIHNPLDDNVYTQYSPNVNGDWQDILERAGIDKKRSSELSILLKEAEADIDDITGSILKDLGFSLAERVKLLKYKRELN